MAVKSNTYRPPVLAKSIKTLSYCLVLAITTVLLAQCSFKKNVDEAPYPQDGRIQKNFFRKYDKNGNDIGARTFLAGWAVTETAGNPREVEMTSVNHTDHLNLEFEISENVLTGKVVNPSYPNDRSRWKTALMIPIKSHYYLERRKDGRGRETDIFEENSKRSHYSARPYINLDLSNLRLNEFDPSFIDLATEDVYDVEWDKENGYLAYTVKASSREMPLLGLPSRAITIRFNFLAFDHDTSFVKTPYAAKNSQYLNVLHVLGKYEEGDPANALLYGSKWDTRQKHTIYLHGFPENYLDVAKESIELWNDAFERIGHGRPFNYKVSDSKYSFDLRKTSMVWIDDRRLSYNAPMGIGQAMADVRNGKILWGQVTLWGGNLDQIINAYSPNAEASAMAKTSNGQAPIVQLGLMANDGPFSTKSPLLPPEIIASTSVEQVKAGLMNSFAYEAEATKSYSLLLREGKVQDVINTSSVFNPVAGLVNSSINPENILNDSQALYDYLASMEAKAAAQVQSQTLINKMSQEMSQIAVRMQQATQVQEAADIYSADYLQKLIGMPTLKESFAYLPKRNMGALSSLLSQKEISNQSIINYLNAQDSSLRLNYSGSKDFVSATMHDADRSFTDQAAVWNYAFQKYNVDKVQAARALAKDLILHELGHMLGMGHNFKENILPVEGSVPETSKYHLKPELFKFSEQKKRAKENFTNYTTVMGYKNGITDVLTPYEDIMPGPNDLLVMEYLYNLRYPIYPENAKGQGDFKFQPLNEEGLIKDKLVYKGEDGKATTYRVAFYPQCNDFYATVTMDPYCARWDRGYDAPTLVENYFETYNGNLNSQLTAYSDSVARGSPEAAEGSLWMRSLTTFSRTRLFYDYMRQKFETDIQSLLNVGVEESSRNILNFSETCQQVYNERTGKASAGEVADAQLYNFFKAPGREELVELCAANAKTMQKLETLLQLSGKDYTIIDYNNRYMPWIQGNEVVAGYQRAFGAWKELARRPVKISAMMTIASPRPFIMIGGWTWPVAAYSRPDGGYHISSLYPKEYTSAIASATEMNITMGNESLDRTTSIGQTILSMGYFLRQARFSNDSLKLSGPFLENLRNQTSFKFNLVTVKVTRKAEEGKELAKKFTAVVNNPYQGITETIPEIYMYTNDRTVILPPTQSLMMPVTGLRWLDDTQGYYYAIKLDYSDDFYDRLKTKNVRKTLEEAYYPVMNKCIEGEKFNGLRFYFNEGADEIFPGFTFPSTIAINTEDKNRFFRSLEGEFEKYYGNHGNFDVKPDPRNCEEALRSQGLLVMTAAVLNGYYFDGILDYIEKGN